MKRPSHATVVAYIALFVALGGTAFAASQVGKNAVGSKQLKRNAVTTAKIKKEAITAAKVKKGALTGTQINASTLGTVPNAQNAAVAAALLPTEAWHRVGSPGEPQFENGWTAAETAPVEFYKDHEGIVHLQGAVQSGSGQVIFTLPPGFRPAAGSIARFAAVCLGTCEGTADLQVLGPEALPEKDGAVGVVTPTALVSLYGVTFRAES